MKLYIVHNYVWCEENKPLAIFDTEQKSIEFIKSHRKDLLYCARIYTYDMNNTSSYKLLKEIRLSDMSETEIKDEQL